MMIHVGRKIKCICAVGIDFCRESGSAHSCMTTVVRMCSPECHLPSRVHQLFKEHFSRGFAPPYRADAITGMKRLRTAGRNHQASVTSFWSLQWLHSFLRSSVSSSSLQEQTKPHQLARRL